MMKQVSIHARSAWTRAAHWALVLALALFGEGCGDAEPAIGASRDNLVPINYRGQLRLAERQGELLVIEGDIVVGARDIWPDGVKHDDELGTSQSSLARTIGANFKWHDGIVRYSLDHVDPADFDNVRNALDWWKTVEGLTFVEQAGACTGDCIEFRTKTFNNSPVGRQGGTQVINLQANPATAVVAHEVAHSLGVFHEQSRTDRGSFVTINWSEIRGCTAGATSIAQCGSSACESGSGTPQQNAVAKGCCTTAQFEAADCYKAHNFDMPDPQALLYPYDYDSVMHYRATAFAKSSSPTMSAIQTLPPGVTLGQRTHLSDTDVASVRALYPVFKLRSVLFRNTGNQPLGVLEGRTEEVNQYGGCTFMGFDTAVVVNTAFLVEGTFEAECLVTSGLWTLTYTYPNSSVTSFPPPGSEGFLRTGPVNVLNPGLIAGFTDIL